MSYTVDKLCPACGAMCKKLQGGLCNSCHKDDVLDTKREKAYQAALQAVKRGEIVSCSYNYTPRLKRIAPEPMPEPAYVETVGVSFDPDPSKTISELRQWYDEDFLERVKVHRAHAGESGDGAIAKAEAKIYEQELNKRRRSLQKKAA
ncbi:MAG: hypothetical protein KGJ13_02045 [Patescibacteria group bacterium]|nr:hypothetical protein [Patescibacteria group bacterium]